MDGKIFSRWVEGYFLSVFQRVEKTNLCFLVGGRVSHQQFLHAGFVCGSLLPDNTAHFQQSARCI